MSKNTSHVFRNLIIPIGVLLPTAYFAYDGYKKSTTRSNFELAASRLGFTGYNKSDRIISEQEHQEALLKQLQIAGYFQPSNLWKSISCMGLKDPEITFKQLYRAIKRSHADQSDPSKFNAKILRKNLGKSTKLDVQDTMDLILYISQNAFGRKSGQERNELSQQEWMKEYKDVYLSNAKVLRLVDREVPENRVYDGAWIAGASRQKLLSRVIDYHNTVAKYKLKIEGETVILTGERELWANMDGIVPSVLEKLIDAYIKKTNLDDLDVGIDKNESHIEEGRTYLKGLAQRYNIKLNESKPFIEYKTDEECPPGYFPGRIYPNYVKTEQKRLTETLMSRDIITNCLVLNTGNQIITIMDTLAEEHKRPNTASTAHDAARRFAQRFAKGDKYYDKREVVILFESNNPYIERQTIVTQREVDRVLREYDLRDKGYVVKVEGVGFKSTQDVATVHSEFAALIAEKWKNAVEWQKESPKRDVKSLLFQTRDNCAAVPPQPDLSQVDLSLSFFQKMFDKLLP